MIAICGTYPALSTGLVPLVNGYPTPDYSRMGNEAIIKRIRSRLREINKTARAASLEAGLGADVIRDLERKPDVMPRIDTIEALAPVLETDAGYLAFGVKGGGVSGERDLMTIRGEVAGGLWHEIDSYFDQGELEKWPMPFNPDYPRDAQFGLIVRGTSVNRIAQPGDILACIDIGISGLEPLENDLVIVERQRAQGSQREVTAKRWRQRGKIIELSPDSTDERWREPLLFDPRKKGKDEQVSVIAIVDAVYKPLNRGRSRR